MSDRVPTPWIEVLVVVALALVLILVLSGCRAHCKLAETRCRSERVEICDSRGRWAELMSCERVSKASGTLFVCDRLDDGRNTCLPVEPPTADAGAYASAHSHCWHMDGVALTSVPMQYPVRCCACGEHSTATEKWNFNACDGHGPHSAFGMRTVEP